MRSAPALLFGSGLALIGAPAGAGESGDKELGAYLSAECVTCHQITGRASGGVPMIVAWPDEQFVAVMHSYRSKQRDNPIMQTIAGRLSDEDIAAPAAYFGSLPLQPEVK